VRLIAVRDDERLVRIARIVESEVNGDDASAVSDDAAEAGGESLDSGAPEVE